MVRWPSFGVLLAADRGADAGGSCAGSLLRQRQDQADGTEQRF